MKYGASTFIWASPFSNNSFGLIDKVKELGFDVIEICIEDPSVLDIELTAQAIRESGIEALVCGAFGPNRDISSEDPNIRGSGVEYIKTCIDYAHGLGSKLVSGPMYSATGKARLISEEEKARQWNWAVENIQKVADYAAERGVKLAIEPLNRFETDFLNTVDQAMKFLTEVDRTNVGLLLDTFHMNIEERSIEEAIRKARNKIFSFHACANDRGTPGNDHFNWEAIGTALSDVGYDDYLVIESFTPTIKEIARAVSMWRPLAPSQDSLAKDGLDFLKRVVSVSV